MTRAAAARRIALVVDGARVEPEVEAHALLLDVLRDTLGRLGTRQGCDTAQCGACTVLVDGAAVKSCNLLALQVDGARIDTVEGLAQPDGTLHPMQQAFGEHHALQCGYCTPGMLMRAVAIAAEDLPLEPAAVREAISGNLCRCTGYDPIVDAICDGAERMRARSAR